VHAARPQRFALKVRIPYWTHGASAAVNGRTLTTAPREGYLALERRWAEGDVLTVRLPMRLHAAAMPDDASIQAVMYGPLVLAARLGSAGLSSANLRAGPTPPRKVPEYQGEPLPVAPIVVRSRDPSTWVRREPGGALEFRTVGQARALTLVPLNRVFDERYAVYFQVNEPTTST